LFGAMIGPGLGFLRHQNERHPRSEARPDAKTRLGEIQSAADAR
jgi:hypothetical protein